MKSDKLNAEEGCLKNQILNINNVFPRSKITNMKVDLQWW